MPAAEKDEAISAVPFRSLIGRSGNDPSTGTQTGKTGWLQYGLEVIMRERFSAPNLENHSKRRQERESEASGFRFFLFAEHQTETNVECEEWIVTGFKASADKPAATTRARRFHTQGSIDFA